jgi:peptidoglycan/LPS O-acetylase OafA/YrhL
MINNLTGLRFYMALWVVIYHVKGDEPLHWMDSIIHKGYMGVDVFFVLSGYILTYVYINFFEKKPSLDKSLSFVKKRFARVYPLHLATLLGAVVYLSVLKQMIPSRGELDYQEIIPQFFMIHAWGIEEKMSWNFPSWSVSTEWFAYLFVFPLIHLLYRKLHLINFGLLTLFILSGYFILTTTLFNGDVGGQMQWGIFRIFPEFFLGSFACLIWLSKPSNKQIYFLSILYVVYLGLIWFTFENILFVIILCIPCLLFLLHKGNRVINFLFGSKFVVFLGEISYSIYMTHFFAISVTGIIYANVFEGSHRFLFYLIYLLLTLLFSTLTYYLVEEPGRKWINSIKFKHTNATTYTHRARTS